MAKRRIGAWAGLAWALAVGCASSAETGEAGTVGTVPGGTDGSTAPERRIPSREGADGWSLVDGGEGGAGTDATDGSASSGSEGAGGWSSDGGRTASTGGAAMGPTR